MLRVSVLRALVGATLALCLPSAGRAQNLLANPDFDESAGGQPTGWSGVGFPGTATVFNKGWPDDALAPGSMTFTTANGDGSALVSQCLAVTPGARYLAAYHAFMPGTGGTGGVGLSVYGYTSVDCTTGGQYVAGTLTLPTTGVWLGESLTLVAPAGTIAVKLSLYESHVPGTSFEALADGVYFGRPVKGDFNADGYADLVLDNLSSEAHRVWTMAGSVRVATQLVTPDAPGPSWKLAVTDDFNDDTRTDLVFRDQTTGAMQFWFMNGVAQSSVGSLAGATPPPANWTLAAAADFTHDGQPDLLWRDETTQQLSIWTMSATTYTGAITPNPAQAVNANWAVVLAADLNRDGNTDLLWYNATSGKIVRWLMDANVVRVTGDFTTPSNAGNNNWKVVAAGEYKRVAGTAPDGVDLVWRNETSGKLVEWLLDASGTRVQGAFTAPDSPSPPLGWTVVGPR